MCVIRWLNGAVRTLSPGMMVVALFLVCSVAYAEPAAVSASPPRVIYSPQGWSDEDRATFYTTSQGSRIIPYAWFKALRRLDVDAPFAADQLQRYGYIQNDQSGSPDALPVGFVTDGSSGQVGMTCAACHTAQLDYSKDGATYALRLDGAPSNADFGQFLIDLRAASRATLSDPDRFDVFAKTVLGGSYSPAKASQLKTDFGIWVAQFGDFMDASLPHAPWGPGRIDAFGMIFNRVAGRDLGVASSFAPADAPVSIPFLWNAQRQAKTQWNGGVPNGLYIEGLGRNTGEVFGVFADFKPKVVLKGGGPVVTLIRYKDNSANFAGLQTLEEKIATLKPPPWPAEIFGLDKKLAAEGEQLFAAHCSSGCHEQKVSPEPGDPWVTPVKAVQTDPKAAINAARKSDPGIYMNALVPPPSLGATFRNPAATGDILAGSVVGSLVDEALYPTLSPETNGVWRAIRLDLAVLRPEQALTAIFNLGIDRKKEMVDIIKTHLVDLYRKPSGADEGAAYETRVLHGIWATAPYLHNGSVPNLWELLTPPSKRAHSFMVGSRVFDPKNVGYATDQSPFASGTFLADPENGNGNAGHDYGTDLPDDQRWAIIEYLKTL